MFTDLANTISKVNCFKEKLIYCNTSEILELAEEMGFISIKEELANPPKSFNQVINDINDIAINEYRAGSTVITFLDIVLISSQNFYEIYKLLLKNKLVICPAIHSAGISILGRRPPDCVPSCFSDPNKPSLVAQLNMARENGLNQIAIYDSFRSGFDIDIKQDLALAHEYLKIFNLKHTKTFKFLDSSGLRIQKSNINNNRELKVYEKTS